MATLTAVPIKKLVDTHHFERQISELFISLQEAQVLSATYQTDIALDFFEEKGEIFYQFSTDEPLLFSHFSQEKRRLSQVALFKFKGKKASSLHCTLYAGGRFEPNGILSFFQTSKEGSRALYIDIGGDRLTRLYHAPPFLPSPQSLILKTAVESGKLTQSFEPESIPTEGPFTTWGMCPSVGIDSDSKSCITLPLSTAVFRLIQKPTKI